MSYRSRIPPFLLSKQLDGHIYTCLQLQKCSVDIKELARIVALGGFKLFYQCWKCLQLVPSDVWNSRLFPIAVLVGELGNATFASMLGRKCVELSMSHAVKYMHRDYVAHFKGYEHITELMFFAAMHHGTFEYLEHLYNNHRPTTMNWELMGTHAAQTKNWEQLSWIVWRSYSDNRLLPIAMLYTTDGECQEVCAALPSEVREWVNGVRGTYLRSGAIGTNFLRGGE